LPFATTTLAPKKMKSLIPRRNKKGNNPKKKFLIIFIVLLFSFCTAKKKIELTPQQLLEYQSKIKEADTLFKAGSYTCLKESFSIYQKLLSIPHLQKTTKEKLIKTALLLTIREKELGIIDNPYFREASDLIQRSPSLSGFLIYLNFVNSIPLKTKGLIKDIIEVGSKAERIRTKLKKNIVIWHELFKEKSGTEEFFSYLYISLNCSFSHFFEEKKDLSYLLVTFPHSPMIQYKLSIYPKENPDSLKELIQKEPRFYEVYYFLGEAAFKLRQLITAEKNFLKCYEQIPESSPTVISLATIYFAFEELEKSLTFYNKAIVMAPSYRDALLGKAICLSYLGKNEEAIKTCNELIRLGEYFLGETHYWLAWNQNELEKLDEAWENAEKTKYYLMGYSEVFSLSGIIAFKRGNLETAEENLKEALKINRMNCEAAYYLGKIYTVYEDWKKSGDYYEKAAICNEWKESALNEKIKDIQNSSFSEKRKEIFIFRKKAQLKKITLKIATFYYNAAAGYFNAEMDEEALALAQKAAKHSALKQKAEELILKIKQQK